MLPPCVRNAIHILERAERSLTRELLVAFCTVEAFRHHFPSRSDAAMAELSDRFSWIRAAEPSRFVKQRRLAVGRIMTEVDALTFAP